VIFLSLSGLPAMKDAKKCFMYIHDCYSLASIFIVECLFFKSSSLDNVLCVGHKAYNCVENSFFVVGYIVFL